MQYEKSCGAVIYTVQNGTRFYLVEQMQKGHVSLCKGHVEKDETELQTAEREIREETGLDVEFVEGFRKTIAYFPRMDCMKTVVLFLAYAEHTDARAQEEEVRAIQWLPFENAVEALTFDSTREILRQADAFLDGGTTIVFVSPLVTQVSWTNHLLIMSGSKSAEERHFYLSLCVKEHYSKRELERQMDSAYYERSMLSSKKLPPQSVPQSIRSSILDTYVLEFLDLPEDFSENNLRKAITHNLKQVILEFGKDFTFIGEEYRVQVGGQDFYIDLLFYNRALSCLVPIELKIGKFKPEHIGQINFYLEALDRTVKKPNENPSVGVVLCASKDDAVVEYALSRSMSPTLVSDYKLCLPDKEALQAKLREVTDIALEQADK